MILRFSPLTVQLEGFFVDSIQYGKGNIHPKSEFHELIEKGLEIDSIFKKPDSRGPAEEGQENSPTLFF